MLLEVGADRFAHPLRRLRGNDAAAQAALDRLHRRFVAVAAIERDVRDARGAEGDEDRADRRVQLHDVIGHAALHGAADVIDDLRQEIERRLRRGTVAPLPKR